MTSNIFVDIFGAAEVGEDSLKKRNLWLSKIRQLQKNGFVVVLKYPIPGYKFKFCCDILWSNPTKPDSLASKALKVCMQNRQSVEK